jgi:RNA polymerase sigma factor (sigma-70 family)
MKRSKKKSFREIMQRPCGSESPYWNWVHNHSYSVDGEYIELAEANPDFLSETCHMYNTEVSDHANLLLDALTECVSRLSDREKLVLELFQTSSNSVDEVAKLLKISKRSVQTYLHRIKTKANKIARRIRLETDRK